MFYRWQKNFFEKGHLTFQTNTDSGTIKLEKKVSDLEKKLVKKNEILSELMEEHIALKKSWENLRATWVPHDTRDSIVDFVRYWSDLAEIATRRFISWIGISTSKFYKLSGIGSLNVAREQRRIQRKAVDYAAVSSESTAYPVIV